MSSRKTLSLASVTRGKENTLPVSQLHEVLLLGSARVTVLEDGCLMVRRDGWAAGSHSDVLSLQQVLLVQRQLTVNAEDSAGFQVALKLYVESAAAQSGCLR